MQNMKCVYAGLYYFLFERKISNKEKQSTIKILLNLPQGLEKEKILLCIIFLKMKILPKILILLYRSNGV